jgi:hypothetical protein
MCCLRIRQEQRWFRWRLAESKRQRWRQECLAATCPECGQRRFCICRHCQRPIPDGKVCCHGSTPLRCCDSPVPDDMLVYMLRRLAGIHLAPGVRTIVHDEDRWFAGPAGWRDCGPASWENAVRAWEE